VVSNLSFIDLKNHYINVKNLNTFTENKFNSPKTRQKNARFRRPILKKNNITVDLLNYDENNEV
jgi:hypothetical protein